MQAKSRCSDGGIAGCGRGLLASGRGADVDVFGAAIELRVVAIARLDVPALTGTAVLAVTTLRTESEIVRRALFGRFK